MGNAAGSRMETAFPAIDSKGQLTTKTNSPSYKMSDTADKDAVDGEAVSPQPPKEGEMVPPACLTDKSGDQLPREYIHKWKITDGNKTQRMKELVYTINLLKSKNLTELVTNAKAYDRDFHLLCKGLYRMHNEEYANRRLVLKTLLKHDVPKFLKQYWKAVIAEFDKSKKEADASFNNGQLWEFYGKSHTHSHIVEALGNCYHIFITIWNGSDMKDSETLNPLYNGTAAFVLECLDTYLHPLVVDSTHSQHNVVKACLGILHNFCNKRENSIADLREKHALRIIGKYRNSGTSTLKTKCMLAYSYLLSENDDKNQSVIELEESDIKFLILVLRDAMDSPDLRTVKFGYNAEELIIGLNNIAVVDINKKRLVDAGILPLYVEAMSHKKPTLQEGAANGIWILAFDDESRKRIKEEAGCLDELRKLAKSTTTKVKAAAAGALWKLEGETKHLQMISTKQAKPDSKGKLLHIMISYQWDVQEEVLRVRDRLKKDGYRVWIDVEHMSQTSSTLESMARAVENSALLVPVLTERYKGSPACRQEAEYAHFLKKKMVPIRLQPKYRPDGWLGFMLGSTFFYDLTNADNYETKMVDFLKALGSDAKIKPGEDANPVYNDGNDPEESTAIVPVAANAAARQTSTANAPDIEMPNMPNIMTVFNVTRLRCVNWSKEQVTEWLKAHELEKYVKKFSGLNGKLLAELAAVQFITPEAYYTMMKQEHSMPMIDVLKLNAALRELNQ